MEPFAEPAPRPVPPAAAAGELLRPALELWLVTQVGYGVYAQLVELLWRAHGSETAGLLLYEPGYALLCGVVLWFVRRDPDARRVFARPRPRAVELCLLIGIGTASVLWAWEGAVVPSDTPSPIDYQFAAGWPLWAALLTSAFAPALFEEWMYRGLLLQRFRCVLPVELAIAVQAMLFAAMHFDPVMLLPHFVFGAATGVLRLIAGGLWPCMLMHLLWNGYVTLSVFDVV